MSIAYRTESDFRFLFRKGNGSDHIGASLERYQGRDILALRIWRSAGGGMVNTNRGLNLTPTEFAHALQFVKLALSDNPGDEPAAMPLTFGRVFRAAKELYRGTELVNARCWRRKKDGSFAATFNGLALPTHQWAQIIEPLEEVLRELAPEYDELVTQYENCGYAAIAAHLQAVL